MITTIITTTTEIATEIAIIVSNRPITGISKI